MRNHTATHLLNFAIRDCLLKDSDQKGSSVKPEKFIFDYSTTLKGGLTNEQIQALNDRVNTIIKQNLPVYRTPVPKEEAVNINGLRGMGDNYPDTVRVVSGV